MTIEEKLDRLAAIVQPLADSVAAHIVRIEALIRETEERDAEMALRERRLDRL